MTVRTNWEPCVYWRILVSMPSSRRANPSTVPACVRRTSKRARMVSTVGTYVGPDLVHDVVGMPFEQ